MYQTRGRVDCAYTKGSPQQCLHLQAMEEAVKSGDDHAIDSPIPVEESKAVHL